MLVQYKNVSTSPFTPQPPELLVRTMESYKAKWQVNIETVSISNIHFYINSSLSHSTTHFINPVDTKILVISS